MLVCLDRQYCIAYLEAVVYLSPTIVVSATARHYFVVDKSFESGIDRVTHKVFESCGITNQKRINFDYVDRINNGILLSTFNATNTTLHTLELGHEDVIDNAHSNPVENNDDVLEMHKNNRIASVE